MKNFDTLVDIWQTQKNLPEINYELIFIRFKKQTNKFKIKISLGLAAMIFVVLGIMVLWILIPIAYLSTHLSFSIFIACSLFYILTQIKNLKILANNSYILTPKKYIESLQAFKILRHKENTRNYFFYTLAMAIGFGLYFIEFFKQVNSIVITLSLFFTVFWFALCYFYLQKVYIKKEEKMFTIMIDELNRIKNQFE